MIEEKIVPPNPENPWNWGAGEAFKLPKLEDD
jgi:hypothetical protein